MANAFHICFFFSSRRRHTRLQGDWSSDVCSSDLQRSKPAALGIAVLREFLAGGGQPGLGLGGIFGILIPLSQCAGCLFLGLLQCLVAVCEPARQTVSHSGLGDRKSTRLNSSHLVISYA